MSDPFRTFQVPSRYDDALERHAHFVEWQRGVTCPCINDVTAQPLLTCSLCGGRGRFYKPPGPQHVYDELVRHDRNGRIFPKYTPVVDGTISVRSPARDNTGNTLRRPFRLRIENPHVPIVHVIPTVQPTQVLEMTGSGIPRTYEPVWLDYSFDPTRIRYYVTGGTWNPTTFSGRIPLPGDTGLHGKRFPPPRVLEITHFRLYFSAPYAVLSFAEGDLIPSSILPVPVDLQTGDYTIPQSVRTSSAYTNYDVFVQVFGQQNALRPVVTMRTVSHFRFLVSQISEKQRYTDPFITREADAQLTVPSWARVSPNDLFTVLAAEQIADSVIDPRARTDAVDVVRDVYDIVRVLEIRDSAGTYYPPETSVEIEQRNRLRWRVPKPTRKYTVQYLYNPTYVAIEGYPSLRTAENKQFVSKINLKKWSYTG